MSGITFLKQNPSKLGWDSPIRKMVCGLSFLIWLALLQTTLAVNVPGPNGTVVTQILSATSSNPEVKVVEDRDLGKILVYPPQPKEFTVKIIARIMYPDDQYLEKISTVMVGGAGVTIESNEIRNSLILATLKVAPGASGGRFSITYENEDNPNHKGCNVRLLPVDLRDVNGAGDADDVTIAPWDTSQNIANNNIAWIDAHQSAQNTAPRMPQLEFRVPGLPDGLTIEAKLNVQYTRGNGERAARNQAEDRVRIPVNGNFAQVDGDSWQLYNEADWQTELTERGFFGGEATLTYQIKKGADVVVGPEEIDFRIGGENPDDARCRTYIESRPNAGSSGNLWFAYAIAKSESADYNNNTLNGNTRYNQFLELPGEGAGVNFRQRRTRDVGRPLWGNDGVGRPGGYAMFQVTSPDDEDMPRREIWNWQENITAGIAILESKRVTAYADMANQRQQSTIALPAHTVRGVTFQDGTNRIMEAAQTMKLFNGASRSLFTNPDGESVNGFVLDSHSSGNYCYWRTVARVRDPAKPNENNPNSHGNPPSKDGNIVNVADSWGLSRLNILNFNYVDRVCSEVEADTE